MARLRYEFGSTAMHYDPKMSEEIVTSQVKMSFRIEGSRHCILEEQIIVHILRQEEQAVGQPSGSRRAAVGQPFAPPQSFGRGSIKFCITRV